MLPLERTPGRRALLLTALIGLLMPFVLLGCQPIVRPTGSPVPTLDLVGTVTALAVPAVATQTAVSGASTQVAQLQATGTALVDSQTAVAGQTASALNAVASQTAAAQGAAATQAAGVAAATAQAATSTALAQAAADQAATATALAQQVAAQAGTATALAKVIPTATPTPVPPTVPVMPPPPCVVVNPALASIADKAANAGLDLGCPTQPAASTPNGALQEYWANVTNSNPNTHLRSLMIWYGDVRTIYVIQGDDTAASRGALRNYTDTWRDGDPDVLPACVPLQPPAGYLMPVRGFGKVWCTNNLVNVIGWPKNQETAARLLVQTTRTGLLLRISAPDQNAGYLAALDYRAARAVTTNVGP
ncbi:MAG TPA: hypothetical protein VGA61_19030 [Anaerolineae bacterium]